MPYLYEDGAPGGLPPARLFPTGLPGGQHGPDPVRLPVAGPHRDARAALRRRLPLRRLRLWRLHAHRAVPTDVDQPAPAAPDQLLDDDAARDDGRDHPPAADLDAPRHHVDPGGGDAVPDGDADAPSRRLRPDPVPDPRLHGVAHAVAAVRVRGAQDGAGHQRLPDGMPRGLCDQDLDGDGVGVLEGGM